MSETKVTRKELFARIANVMSDDEDVVAMCQKYIEQLSKKYEPKTKPETEQFCENVLQTLVQLTKDENDKFVTSKEVREAYCEEFGEQVSAQKIASTLRKLVSLERAICHEPQTKNGVKEYRAYDED